MNERCKICGSPCTHTICSNCFTPFFTYSQNEVSFAFEMKLPDLSKLKTVRVIDFFRTPIAALNLTDFPNLNKFRASHCPNLVKVTIMNAPNLQVLDLSANKELTSFSSDANVRNIISFDISYCENLSMIPNYEYELSEYVILRHTRISILPKFPKCKFLDISSTNIKDFSNIFEMEQLETIILDHMLKIENLDLSFFSYLPKLNVIETDIAFVTCENWNRESTLSQFWLQNCRSTSNLKEILIEKEGKNENFSAILPKGEFLGQKFRYNYKDTISPSWQSSCRLLYGPWPCPPCYQKPARINRSRYPIPARYNKNIVIASIAGSIFGATVADSLMLYIERQTIECINFLLQGDLDITWSHPRITRRGIDFHRGGFTDNTVMILLTIRSLISKDGKFVDADLSRKIKFYFEEGLAEHQMNVCSTTHAPSVSKIVRDPQFTSKPFEAAKKYWRMSGETPSGNDALTRSLIPGCFLFWDENSLKEASHNICRVTHYDPRCAFASVCLSLLIARLIKFRCGEIPEVDLDLVIEDSIKSIADLTPYMIAEIHKFTNIDELSQLNLKNYSPLALQAIGCALWVLKRNLKYTEGIEIILHAGGDVSTNAAVVGSVLGAKWGLGGIPIDVMEFFWEGAAVYKDLVSMLAIMDIDFKMPSYEDYYRMEFH